MALAGSFAEDGRTMGGRGGPNICRGERTCIVCLCEGVPGPWSQERPGDALELEPTGSLDMNPEDWRKLED